MTSIKTRIETTLKQFLSIIFSMLKDDFLWYNVRERVKKGKMI